MATAEAEELVCDALRAAGFDAFYDIPDPHPDGKSSFVTVRRVGGSLSDFVVDTPQVGVKCYAASNAAARADAQLVRDVVLRMPETYDDVFEVDVNAFYRSDDPVGRYMRWIVTFDLTTTAR